MQRTKTIKKYFDKYGLLTIKNKAYRACLTELFQWLIKTDEAKNDITTKALDLKGNTTASIISKQDGIVAGIEEIEFLTTSFIPHISLILSIKDGDRVKAGDMLMQLSGSTTDILSYERTILNILGRMSGIATQTQKLIQRIVDVPGAPLIAATRKAPWTLVDKKAVAVGGGGTHRLHLSDEIMIKDNHLKAIKQEAAFKSTQEAIRHAVEKSARPQHVFEIEVETPIQAQAAIDAFSKRYTLGARRSILILLLDNWKPADVKQFIEKTKKTDIYNHILFEASGNINQNNIQTWKHTEVDVLSLGSLTHSSPNFDLSLEIFISAHI